MRKGAFEHALSGVRVQAPFGARVQKVQRVQRVEVGASKLLKGPVCIKPYNRSAGEGNAFSPFGGWRHHLPAPLGSVSLDSQSSTTPCESSSLATAERWNYGYLAMEPCLCRKAYKPILPPA